MAVMNFFKSDTFFGLLKLESGGTVIGAVGSFWAFLQIIYELFLIFSLFFVRDFCPQQHFIEDDEKLDNFSKETQHDIKHTVNYAQQKLQNITYKIQEGLHDITDKEYSCTFVSKVFVGGIIFIAIAINIISIIAHYRLIKGIEEYNPVRFQFVLKFYKFFIATRILLFLVALVWTFFKVKMIFMAFLFLIFLVIDIYAYQLIDKLRIKFELTLPLNAETKDIHLKREIGKDIDPMERIEL
ncbi:hypothetical protein PVAND_016202 [Polypedilum vanderplanki]|uniref:Uncharacterized protein n=1 Tax=Polypedilum vanderplanki TaxID=319348 RepID=A0A9J6BF64_POLVA|nr:hypothetical protein PVAND_016202 [Polypedilum vanderplanki]